MLTNRFNGSFGCIVRSEDTRGGVHQDTLRTAVRNAGVCLVRDEAYALDIFQKDVSTHLEVDACHGRAAVRAGEL